VVVTMFNITDARLSLMGDEQEGKKLLFQYNLVREEMTVYEKVGEEWIPVERQVVAMILHRGTQTLKDQLGDQLGM
jgi:hypothetical protein